MPTSSNTGILVFAHGSRIESANEAVREVTRQMAEQGGFPHAIACFLELGKPDLASAVGQMVELGVERALIVPYFLTVGMHLKRDLPELMAAAREQYPDFELEATPPLDGHPSMTAVLRARAEEGLAAWASGAAAQ
jgi:sirohydrochlorin ferrochelatase